MRGSTGTKRGSHWYQLANYGQFEGYVGKDPKMVENRRGTLQCFLDVGQTPRLKKDGEWIKLRPVWMHFAVFGPLATHVATYVRTGMRVLVEYKTESRFHPQFKYVASHSALCVRPIADAFVPKEIGDRADYLDWRPLSAKDGKRWPKEVPPPPDTEPPDYDDGMIEEPDAAIA